MGAEISLVKRGRILPEEPVLAVVARRELLAEVGNFGTRSQVFCPDGFGDKTYAEIVEEGGLEKKLQASQSIKALKKFMQHRLDNAPSLFPAL